MMLQYFTGPAVGAVIGYITNDIAIRMLFRPREPKYLFGWRMPFTPGIIPKEKNRIAAAIGQSISQHLMNSEVLAQSLLSDEMLDKVRQGVDDFVRTQQGNDETLEQFVLHFLTADEVTQLRDNATGAARHMVVAKLQEAVMGERIAHMATEHILDKTRGSLAGRLGADKLLNIMAEPIEAHLARHINEALNSHSDEMVGRMLDEESGKLLSMPMSRLIAGHGDKIEQAKDGLVSVYRTVISDHLPRILEAIDISAIVERRICQMDMEEAEGIIMQVMKKELRAIVWLGALLGCVMGTVMTLLD